MTNSPARDTRGIGRKGQLLLGAALSFVLVGLSASQALAANVVVFPQDTTLHMSGTGVDLLIPAGSVAQSLTITPTTFTVTVAAGGTFTVRWPGPTAGTLTNDGSLPSCRFVGGNNEINVVGPTAAPVTFTPNASVACPVAGGGGNQPPSVSLSSPNGGETWAAGTTHQIQILWGSGGNGIQSVNLLLSTDGGSTYPVTIASGLQNTGYYGWTIPSMTTTATARVEVEAVISGTVVASAQSAADFTIVGTAPAPSGGGGGGGGGGASAPPETVTTATNNGSFQDTTSTFPAGTYAPTPYSDAEKAAPSSDPTSSGGYDAGTASSATPTIDVDKGILPPPPGKTLPCVGGDLLKTAASSAVYYCGKNGRRYVFPDPGIYASWYSGFGGVKTISADAMAAIPLAGNVTYRPGVRMVKIQSDPRTYAVSRDGLLRWVPDEATAKALYGVDWNKKIDDVDPSFFFNYKIGDPIASVQ